MNEKKILLFAFILAVLIMVTGYFYFHWQCAKDKTGNNQNIGLPNRCLSDSDCPDDYSCFNSRKCTKNNQGITECGNQEGDLLCHKNCSSQKDCIEAELCQSVTIWSLDIPLPKNFCN